MGGKLVITVRFNPEGTEAELYRKIQQGKRSAGLSTPEYVKAVFSEYFDSIAKQNDDRRILQGIREECSRMADRLEKMIKRELQEKEADLIRTISMAGGNISMPGNISTENQREVLLPEMSGEIPEEALSFLDKY